MVTPSPPLLFDILAFCSALFFSTASTSSFAPTNGASLLVVWCRNSLPAASYFLYTFSYFLPVYQHVWLV